MHAGDGPAPAGGGRAVALGASRRRSIASPGLAAARRTSPVSPCTRFDMSIRDRCVSVCLEVVRNVKDERLAFARAGIREHFTASS